MRRHMEIYLFDTCTHKCAYCGLAENGSVLDNTQLQPYRDPEFIDILSRFFLERTNSGPDWEGNWLVSLTGGEPLLMPNLPRFVENIGVVGNKVAFYTALLVGDNNPAWRYLLEGGAAHTEYLMVSFHPEAEHREEQHFSRLETLKKAGHSVIFRFVGHPKRLHRMPELAARCRDLDIAFHPTPLFSPEYPAKYTPEERAALESHATSLSQIIQLEGGMDVAETRCSAGTDIFAVYLRNGDITPCVSTRTPVLGNIYDNWLRPIGRDIRCPLRTGSCLCDIHFQEGIVRGADDRSYFRQEMRGYVQPREASELRARIEGGFSKSIPGIGQTKTADFEALSVGFVKSAYQRNREYFHGVYAGNDHPEFLRRRAARN